MVTFEYYLERFEIMQRWMRDDLTRASVDAYANFLVAMGIFNYIEILGSFYEIEETRGYSRRRFDFAFKNLMGPSYKEVSDKLDTLTGSSYQCLRCGMTHEYLVKTYKSNVSTAFTVYGVNSQEEFDSAAQNYSCGIELQKLSDGQYHLKIINPKLIRDLNEGFEEYKRRLANQDYKDRFMSRCQTIHLESFKT